MRYIFWLGLFAAMVFASAAASDDKPPGPPGAGWEEYEVRDVFGQLQGKGLRRPVAGSEHRRPGGRTTLYNFPLNGLTLAADRADDRRRVGVRVDQPGPAGATVLDFTAEFDAKGAASYHRVSIGPHAYIDLDGDGLIDCGVEWKGGRRMPWITVAGRQAEVHYSRAQFERGAGGGVSESLAGSGEIYTFTGGEWRRFKP